MPKKRQELPPEELAELLEIEHMVNVEMFGDDAEYMEITGLDSEIGNK